MNLWNPTEDLIREILIQGGFVNAHSHLDRAYTITKEIMEKTKDPLQEKWSFVDEYKRSATVNDYMTHIEKALNVQQFYNHQAVLSFIDIDPVCEFNAITAARILQTKHQQIQFVTACQTLKGVLDTSAKRYIEKAMDEFDILGGLPGKDKGREADHIDQLFFWAAETGKRVHVHVDQLNTPDEKETELLARKTIEHGLEGRVTAVHSISLACHPIKYRKEIYKVCKDAGLSFISCPSAWIDHPRTERLMPFHNAVTPIEELLENDLTVALGTDNICDVYKPYCDGDMINEMRLMIDACKIYDKNTIVDICVYNGLEVLGLADHLGEE